MEIPATFWNLFIPLVSAAIGFWLKSILEKRKELISEITKERRGMYQDFVSIIVNLIKTSSDENKSFDEEISKLFDYYNNYILYASPSVIKATSDYFQFLYKSDESDEITSKNFLLLTNILAEMRKDLGLSNRRLGSNNEELIRVFFKDFDDYFGEINKPIQN